MFIRSTSAPAANQTAQRGPAPQASKTGPGMAGDALLLARATSSSLSDPLTSFPTLDDYKNMVIKKISEAVVAQQDLEAAQEALNSGKGNPAEVEYAQDKVDTLALQLGILRDQVDIPEEWTRGGFLFFGGPGFDKEAFWKEQMEALPSKSALPEVKDEPKPEAPKKEAPKPPAKPSPAPPPGPAPKPVPAPPGASDEKAESLMQLALQAEDDGRYDTADTYYRAAADAAVTATKALEVANVAEDDGRRDAAEYGFKRATGLSETVDKALGVAIDSENEGFYTVSDEAYDQATALVSSPAEALDIAVTAEDDGRYGASDRAYARATGLVEDVDMALEIAAVSENDGRYDESDRAYRRAADLSTTIEQASKVAETADSDGRSAAADYAYERLDKIALG